MQTVSILIGTSCAPLITYPCVLYPANLQLIYDDVSDDLSLYNFFQDIFHISLSEYLQASLRKYAHVIYQGVSIPCSIKTP